MITYYHFFKDQALLIWKKNQNLIFLTISTFLSGVLTLICNGVWVRFLSQDTYGNFKLVLSISSIAATFCFLGAGQAAVMSSAQKTEGNFWILIKEKINANIFGSMILLAACFYYAFFNSKNSSLSLALLVFAFFFPLFNISDIWTSWLNGDSRFLELSINKIASALIPFLALFISIALNKKTLFLIVFLFISLVILQNLYVVKKVSKRINSKKKNKSILKFGKKTNFPMLFGSLLSLDLILVNHYFSAKEVATLSVALIFPEFLKSAFSIFSQLFAPGIYATKSPARLWLSFKSRFLTLTVAFICIGLIGFAMFPEFIRILFSSKYETAAECGKWLWLTISCTGSFTYLGYALIATRQPIYIYIPYVGYPLCLVALFFAFMGFGVSGMIYARSAAAALLATFYGVAFFVYLSKEDRARV